MIHDLALYAWLLLLLVGSCLYGFLARELLRHPDVAPGNTALRVLTLGLTAGYAGGLLARITATLAGDGPWRAHLDAALDLVRGAGWLATFPLLSHAVFLLLPERRPSRAWLVPGYLTLALFAPALARFLAVPAPAYEEVARDVFGLYVLHASLSLAVTGGFIVFALRRVEDPGLLRFLRLLLALAAAMLLFNGLGAAFPERLAGWVWLASSQLLWLLLGATFLFHVQRYNLLRLSLSYRSVRHFLVLLGLVALVMLVSPTVGPEGREGVRRLLAWALLLGLLYGLAGTTLLDAAARRSPLAKRLLSRAVTPAELRTLGRRLEDPELQPGELLALTAAELSGWLASPARFLGPHEDAAFRAHFAAPETFGFTRIDPPGPALADALVRGGLHAVFPLRAGGELQAVLALEVSGTGAGYDRQEREGVELALQLLGAVLHGRRQLLARLSAERLAAERERLSMLGLVAASLAHELKNPLSSMKALSQALSEELTGTPHQRDVAVILEQIERLNASASEVLGFARPQGSEVDLARLVRSAAHVLSPEARRTGITLDDSAVADVGSAPGGAGAWQTIVFNLLLNAIRHAPAASRVMLRLTACGGGLVLEAENGGDAIPPEVERQLFSPFVTQGGTGLGLHLVARRAGELGGRVEVENEPGRVVFRVRVDRVGGAGRVESPR